MDAKLKVLVFAGSLRANSYNKKLATIASAAAEKCGADVTYIDLKEYQMPIYDEDIETSEGLPENAHKLKKLMKESDAFIISSPEYNSSITGVLKNSIDWASRKASKDELSLECFKGKVALIMSASPGGFGGLRGLVHLRAILGNIGVFVLPEQKAIAQAFNAFSDDGSLKEKKDQEAIDSMVQNFVTVASKIKL